MNNTIDTIYYTNDLLVGRLIRGNDVLPIVIKQTTKPCCDNAMEITGMICDALVLVALVVVIGWLVWRIVSHCLRNKDANNERNYKERESLIKQKQEYQVRMLDEFSSCKKIWDYVEEEKKKLEKKKKEQEKENQNIKVKEDNFVDVFGSLDKLESMLARKEDENYQKKLQDYIGELERKINKLNEELGIKTVNDNLTQQE